jgi:hypothetical protein
LLPGSADILSSRPIANMTEINILKSVILSAVSNGCEIWYLTSRTEHTFRVSENRVLRITSGLREMK